jgi:hypothetical protein
MAITFIPPVDVKFHEGIGAVEKRAWHLAFSGKANEGLPLSILAELFGMFDSQQSGDNHWIVSMNIAPLTDHPGPPCAAVAHIITAERSREGATKPASITVSRSAKMYENAPLVPPQPNGWNMGGASLMATADSEALV